MILASYQLDNFWHGLGHVGHIALAVLVFLVALAVYAWTR